MRHSKVFLTIVASMALLSLSLLAGCQDLDGTSDDGSGSKSGSTGSSVAEATSTAPTTAVTPISAEATTTTGAPTTTSAPTTVSGGTSTTVAADTTASTVLTGTTGPTTGSFPDLTPEQVIDLVAASPMYPAGAAIQVFDCRTFGDLAGAYVWAEHDDVYLVVFSWQSGGWMIMDFMNGPWEDMRVRLVNSFNPPQEFLDWANPEGD